MANKITVRDDYGDPIHFSWDDARQALAISYERNGQWLTVGIFTGEERLSELFAAMEVLQHCDVDGMPAYNGAKL